MNVIKKQVIDPDRDHPLRFVAMLPNPDMDYGDLKFDFDGLAFLLNTEHRQLLMDLVVVQNKFGSAVQLMNMRSKIRHEVSPILEQAGIRHGGSFVIEQIHEALGERRLIELSRITDDAVEQVDDAIASTREMANNLYKALKSLYPKKKDIVINFKRIEESEEKS